MVSAGTKVTLFLQTGKQKPVSASAFFLSSLLHPPTYIMGLIWRENSFVTNGLSLGQTCTSVLFFFSVHCFREPTDQSLASSVVRCACVPAGLAHCHLLIMHRGGHFPAESQRGVEPWSATAASIQLLPTVDSELPAVELLEEVCFMLSLHFLFLSGFWGCFPCSPAPLNE